MSDGNDASDGEDGPADLFQEPEGYYEPEKSATSVSHRMLDGRELNLRLVGHNPLWGHHLWQAGRIISTHLEQHSRELVHDQSVLELGAGAGLPSVVAALCGARAVLATDYPDADLVANLQANLAANVPFNDGAGRHHVAVAAEGYLWGAPTERLRARLAELVPSLDETTVPSDAEGFDLLILADLLFNHSEHAKLLDSVRETLKRTAEAQALVFFTPYRPWLLEKDRKFFDMAGGDGWEAEGSGDGDFTVTKILEHVMDKVMFEEDRGDEMLRRTVFGYSLRWRRDRLPTC